MTATHGGQAGVKGTLRLALLPTIYACHASNYQGGPSLAGPTHNSRANLTARGPRQSLTPARERQFSPSSTTQGPPSGLHAGWCPGQRILLRPAASLPPRLRSGFACERNKGIIVYPLVQLHHTISPIGFTPVEGGSSNACSRAKAMARAVPLTTQGHTCGCRSRLGGRSAGRTSRSRRSPRSWATP
jgi:hypothetical protein